MLPIEFTPEVNAQLDDLAARTKYPFEAYDFVLHEIYLLMAYREALPKKERGVSGQKLCWKLHDSAMLEFNDETKNKLESWNVLATEDFGAIVRELADKGLLTVGEEDFEENFNRVYDFEDAFQELHFKPVPVFPKRWRVSALLAITTILAIACAGIAKSGFDGGIGTLLSSWLILIGTFITYLGVNERTKGWVFATIVGVTLVGSGILGFAMITS